MGKKLSAFLKLRRRYFVSQARAALVFGVTVRTVRNWERREAPRPVLAYLQIAYERDLGAIHPDWRGFRIGLNGKLYGPEKLQISAWHLRHWRECVGRAWEAAGSPLG